jgi:transposase
LPENWGDQQIEQAVFPQRPDPAIWRKHPEPDWPQIHQELQTHKDLTLQLVWQEGRENNPEGYGYSRYVAATYMLRDHLKPMTHAAIVDVHAT